MYISDFDIGDIASRDVASMDSKSQDIQPLHVMWIIKLRSKLYTFADPKFIFTPHSYPSSGVYTFFES